MEWGEGGSEVRVVRSDLLTNRHAFTLLMCFEYGNFINLSNYAPTLYH